MPIGGSTAKMVLVEAQDRLVEAEIVTPFRNHNR